MRGEKELHFMEDYVRNVYVVDLEPLDKIAKYTGLSKEDIQNL